MIILSVLVLSTNNPVGNRFRQVFKGDPVLAQKDNFDPGIYFNGMQFRLLQFKLVPAILNEKKAWLTGVGPAHAQACLNDQYIRRNMYTGNAVAGDIGYRAFNTHDQFLESLLRHGIIGLFLFCLLFAGLIMMVIQIPAGLYRIFLILILSYSLVESVLEVEYGIFIFTFFPVFLAKFGEQPTRELREPIH
jgi:hypothetical protein